MALNTPRDLFVYELGIMQDAEKDGRLLFEWMAGRAQNGDVAQTLRTQAQDSRQHLTNIRSCLQALGVSPIETPSETVDGMRNRFELFVGLKPSPDVMDQFAVSTAIRFLHFGIAGYRELVDRAVLMGEGQCSQCLHDNLVRKDDSASTLERVGHDLDARLLTAA